jgi:hypothetical protein
MIDNTEFRANHSKVTAMSKDVSPCPPKRRLSLDMTEVFTISNAAFSNVKIDVDLTSTVLLDQQKSQQDFQSLFPSKRNHREMKLCRFDELFPPPQNSSPLSRHKARNSRNFSKQSNSKKSRSGFVGNASSCSNNLGSTKKSKSRSFMGSSKKQNRSFSNLLPTITEFQRTTFENEVNEFLFMDASGAFTEQTSHTTSPRRQANNKRSSRSIRAPDQRSKRSWTPSLSNAVRSI